jgi:hypothetical protein
MVDLTDEKDGTTHKVDTALPLKEPYRTGCYLSYDYPPGTTDTHFREGTAIDAHFRASGSRQLDLRMLESVLEYLARKVPDGKVHLVDLRQESHVFLNKHAVSWYADKDWANVGQPLEWIVDYEASQIKWFSGPPPVKTQIFQFKKNDQNQVVPMSYSEVIVDSAQSEAKMAPDLCEYHRIPVTDHCAPSPDAAKQFVALCRRVYEQPEDQSWIHFHCHGGDGRTTTFLAMYDMVCWAKANSANPDSLLPFLFPSIKYFANRELELFDYDLDPDPTGCEDTKDWKYALSAERWTWLEVWRQWIIGGGLTNKNLSPLFSIQP